MTAADLPSDTCKVVTGLASADAICATEGQATASDTIRHSKAPQPRMNAAVLRAAAGAVETVFSKRLKTEPVAALGEGAANMHRRRLGYR